MRSGCDRPATTRLSYDAEQLAVWLDELTLDPAPVQEVCDFHAERLTAPRGWTVSDRRAPRPTNDVLPSGRAPATVATVPTIAPPSEDAPVPAAAPADAPVGEPPPEPQVDADASPAAAPARAGRRRRRAETEVDAGDAPVPTGSLLSRAFRSAGPQHSVLTQGQPADGPESQD